MRKISEWGDLEAAVSIPVSEATDLITPNDSSCLLFTATKSIKFINC